MNPTAVLDQQALLRDRLSTVAYQRMMQGYMEDVHRKGSGVVVMSDDGNPSGYVFCQREIRRLGLADAYFVSKDMCQVARWAAAGLDETDTFRQDLWPSAHGFLWLDDALVSTEAWGRTIVSKALVWGRSSINGQAGTMITVYTPMSDERDQVNQDLLTDLRPEVAEDIAEMGDLHVHHVQWIPDGKGVGAAHVPAPEGYERWANIGSDAKGVLGPQTLSDEATNDNRYILALLMLLNQTVTTVTAEDADKRTAKRMRRMSLPARVTVVALRRQEGQRREGETMVEWAHRWVVKGHWAWRKCGADYPGAQPYEKGHRVRLFIAPYVKGPEDMPLIVSQKVYSLSR